MKWERVLRADEANLAYFAERTDLPGVAIFHAVPADAPEFDVAVVYRVRADAAEATLQAVIDKFRALARRPRIRLSPCSRAAGWPRRLRRAGYVETSDRLGYFSVPVSVSLQANPDIVIRKADSPQDADAFSAIQVVGFAIPSEHQAWDRELAQRHVGAGRYAFYLAWLNGSPVGAARSIHLPGSVTSMAALATVPDARGRGVGVSLLAHMIEVGRRIGDTEICGTVTSGSYADALYARLGFVRLFETRTFAGPV